jgi:hypothetical protein
MHVYQERLLRAIKLEPTLFEEVEADSTATNQAILTVVLSSMAAGFNGVSGGLPGLALHTTVALISWIIWAYLTYFIGTQLMPEPQTKSSLGELLRCTGFATAPGLFQVLGFIPVVGGFIRLAVSFWMLAAFIIAVRQALDYTSTRRAVGVCLVGWLIMMALNAILWIMTMGRLPV